MLFEYVKQIDRPFISRFIPSIVSVVIVIGVVIVLGVGGDILIVGLSLVIPVLEYLQLGSFFHSSIIAVEDVIPWGIVVCLIVPRDRGVVDWIHMEGVLLVCVVLVNLFLVDDRL